MMALPVSNILIENYDNAIYEWLGQLRIDYGARFGDSVKGSGSDGYFSVPLDLSSHPIYRVLSTAERAFADNRIGLTAQGFLDPADYDKYDHIPEDRQHRLAPLPMVRFHNTGTMTTTERHSPGIMRTIASTGTTFQQRRYPTPSLLQYEIEFYSKTRYTKNYMRMWLLNQITDKAGVNTFFLNVRNPEPYGTKIVPVYFNGITDTDDLETKDDSDRMLRFLIHLDVFFLNFDLTGDSLPNNGNVPAIYSLDLQTYLLGEADFDIDKFGEVVNATSPYMPLKVLDEKVVQAGHLPPPNTTAGLVVVRDWDFQKAAQFDILADTDVVELIGLPFPPVDLVQGRIGVKWRCLDDSAPPVIYADVLWRDSTTGELTVAQTHQLTYKQDFNGCYMDFATAPLSASKDISVRFRRGTNGPDLRFALTTWRLWRSRYQNLVSVGSRTLGPALSGTTRDITITGAAPGMPYTCRAFVQKGTQPVTVTLYADASATTVIQTKTFSASGEFIAYGTPAAGTFTLRVSTPSVDSTLQLTGILLTPCLPKPV